MPAGLDIEGVRAHLRRQVDRNFEAFGLPGPDVHVVEDREVPVRDGGHVTVRLYRTDRHGEFPPVHLMLHGGGWTTGSIDELVADAMARHTAVGADVAVATLEYRLAPEFPFPTAVLDVVDTVRWLGEQAGRIGLSSEVSLGGNSAGGNLAAAAVLADRQLGLRGLVLEVPALDLTGGTARAARPDAETGLGLDLDQMSSHVLTYLGERHADKASPMASPLLAPDLSGFPPTWLMTAELDPLEADGAAFAERLAEAGVWCHLACYPGALHGSPILTRSWPIAHQWMQDRISAVRTIHHDQGR